MVLVVRPEPDLERVFGEDVVPGGGELAVDGAPGIDHAAGPER
jgi:hypothetical protein